MVIVLAWYFNRSGYIAMVPPFYRRSEFYAILIIIPFVIAFYLRRLLVGLYGERIIFDAIPVVIAGVSTTILFCHLFDRVT
jgi:hypothetical protein